MTVCVPTAPSANAEDASSGCAAGTISSAAVDGPVGYIKQGGVRAYMVSVTVGPTTDTRCNGQPFTLPLTVKLASATADR